jgi:hypothetical protein
MKRKTLNVTLPGSCVATFVWVIRFCTLLGRSVLNQMSRIQTTLMTAWVPCACCCVVLLTLRWRKLILEITWFCYCYYELGLSVTWFDPVAAIFVEVTQWTVPEVTISHLAVSAGNPIVEIIPCKCSPSGLQNRFPLMWILYCLLKIGKWFILYAAKSLKLVQCMSKIFLVCVTVDLEGIKHN